MICRKCGLEIHERGIKWHRECKPIPKKYFRICATCGDCEETSLLNSLAEKCKKCARIGSCNPNWKGGITPENNRLRNSDEYKAWRKAVFERDAYKCRECGVVGGCLHAHHIKEWSRYPEFRFSIDNGLTLCFSCHSKTSNYLNRAKLQNANSCASRSH